MKISSLTYFLLISVLYRCENSCRDRNCSECPLSSKKCFICNRGYFLEKDSCLKCFENCRICKDGATCKTCSFFYAFKDQHHTECVTNPLAYIFIGMNVIVLIVLIGFIWVKCCRGSRNGKKEKENLKMEKLILDSHLGEIGQSQDLDREN